MSFGEYVKETHDWISKEEPKIQDISFALIQNISQNVIFNNNK